MLEALKCPTCGGPVRVAATETITICLYCNGALKIARPEAGDARVEVDASIPEATIATIKDLVLHGKKVEAATLYRETAKCDQAAADAAIASYVTSAVADVIMSGTFNAIGMLLYPMSFVVFGAGIYLHHRTESDPLKVLSFVLIAFGVLNVIVLTKGALRTIRYFSATRGEATILRHALIGKNGDVSSFMMLLQVREPSGATFETEVAFPASKTGTEKVRVGRRFHVKYFPGNPKSVVFAGNIDA